jgi:hypothetical protein
MDCKVLVAYPSADAAARAVAETIAEGLADAAIAADVLPENGVGDLTPYGAVVLGFPLGAAGLPEIAHFGPGRLPLAIFGLEPPGAGDLSHAAALAELERGLGDLPWLDPVAVEVFGTTLLWEPAAPGAHIPPIDLREHGEILSWTHTLPGLLRLPVPVG